MNRSDETIGVVVVAVELAKQGHWNRRLSPIDDQVRDTAHFFFSFQIE